jgi:hypothetical protein
MVDPLTGGPQARRKPLGRHRIKAVAAWYAFKGILTMMT